MAVELLIPSAFLLQLLLLHHACRVHGDVDKRQFPIRCPKPSPAPVCSSFLYVVPRGLNYTEVANQYAANASLIQIAPPRGEDTDFLVRVPCACETAAADSGGGNFTALFHDANYTVKANDTADDITDAVFSGLAWGVSAEKIDTNVSISVRLLCGCWTAEQPEVVVVSYAVQLQDTLTSIANQLNSDVEAITEMNPEVSTNPDFLKPGQVLFVPMGARSAHPPSSRSSKGKEKTALITLSISISILLILLGGLLIFLHSKRRSVESTVDENFKENLSKTSSTRCKLAALESQLLTLSKNNEAGTTTFRSERPVIFTIEEVVEATANFDESRKIGEGGYGSVYFGMLASEEVAIKKMKSSKSKEFLAELNVLCKVHHRNVVELIGYATGDDHLYLVYKYVQNGSLNEHLHDPLLKGHQTLSWTARAQIGLDTARGIEYIHDHTKATCVHRDIKTSNILLDSALRAKVADFGLAKLVEHSDEEVYFATRLVGTPGYLPPESVRELQMSTKTDVFAFGVVLAELITGQRALIPDRKEPSKMRSLVTIMKGTFLSENPEAALEEIIDKNLNHTYPAEEVYKMVDIAMGCLSDDPVSRPEMRDIIANLSQILMASIEWEASLGGNSQVFSGVFTGR
ncbi:lysM domain receptor-like kinase 3 [Canna indica]|uniref:LysM domain receptor-like kinase 3 n=1 Tax=Canna indica TaxID=4628 RepID=A0AAQ3KMS1_9LILI|nr:lysM domain receptor-like kinase 3 [Canna indica]